MASAPGPCANEECSFNQGGSCVEGENPEDCPFRHGRSLILPVEGAVSGGEEGEDEAIFENDSGAIHVGPGIRLAPADCADILGAGPSRVVSLLAPKGAGKTSLIAGFYEMFLEGRSAALTFSGSRTLHDFEQICHLSRAESGLFEADMERTRRSEGLGYFHVSVSKDGERLELLLGDRPGETVTAAGSGAGQAATLSELPSATAVAYLIDGDLLADPERRALPKAQAMAILESIRTAGFFAHKPSLAIILTKTDLEANREDLDARFTSLAESVKQRFESCFKTVRAFRTAANPTTSTDPFVRGYGLEELLSFLLEDTREPKLIVEAADPPIRSFETQGHFPDVSA